MSAFAPVELKVWGSLALFADVSFPSDRQSYQTLTPSAARGICESIYWHKPVEWRIRDITVLNPIKYFSILRNEVTDRATATGDALSINDKRTQRHAICLRDVAYLIRADTYVPPELGGPEAAVKYRDQFRRRVRKGQCWARPCLGVREFACHFAEPDESDHTAHESFLGKTIDMGRMLFDIEYGAGTGARNRAHFFDAKLENGVLRIDPALYDKLAGRAREDTAEVTP